MPVNNTLLNKTNTVTATLNACCGILGNTAEALVINNPADDFVTNTITSIIKPTDFIDNTLTYKLDKPNEVSNCPAKW